MLKLISSTCLLVCSLFMFTTNMKAQAPTITVLAGSAGFLDSTLQFAQFRGPHHIIYNQADQSYYVADRGNFRIRVIKGGNVTTLAGDGTLGTNNGVGRAARFTAPVGLALNPTGDTLYVADAAGNRDGRIRFVVLRGADSARVGTLAGGSGGNPGPSNNAVGTQARIGGGILSLARVGRFLYFSDFGSAGSNKIRRMELAGTFPVTSYDSAASAFTDNLSNGFGFGEIEGVAAGSGDSLLYFTIKTKRKVYKLNLITNTFSELAGSGASGFQDGPFLSASFAGSLGGIVYDPSANDLYVTEKGGGNQLVGIRRLDLDSQKVVTIAGGINVTGTADGIGAAVRFNGPQNLSIGSTGLLLIADANNSRIRTYNQQTNVVGTLAGMPDTTTSLTNPLKTRLNNPYSVVVDRNNNIWFTDRNSHTIRFLNRATGTLKIVAGSLGVAGSSNGPALDSARFTQPFSLALKGDSLFISDGAAGGAGIRLFNLTTNRVSTFSNLRGDLTIYKNQLLVFGCVDAGASFQNRIIRFNLSTGIRDTIAGTGGNGFLQGPGRTSQIFNPRTGSVYNDTLYFVTGRSSKPWRIRRLALNSPTLELDTFLTRLQTDALNNPSQVVVDGFGTLYAVNSPFGGGIFRASIPGRLPLTNIPSGLTGNGIQGICVDTTRNNLILTDASNSRILRYNPLYSVANVAPSFNLAINRDTLFRTDNSPKSLTGTAINISANTTIFNQVQNQTVTLNARIPANQQVLFAQLPAVSPTGTLTYQLANAVPFSNTNNISVNVSIVARDNGGTQNGGVDSSAVQTFVIVIRYQNLPPVFNIAQDTLNVPRGLTTAQTVTNFLTGVASGAAQEPGQTITFSISNDNPSLFTTIPALTGSNQSRNLTYRINGDLGLANVRIVSRDNGGVVNGGLDSTVKSFVLRVVLPVSTNELSHTDIISIHPNPVSSNIHLKGLGNNNQIQIIDQNGRIKMTVKTGNEHTLDVSQLANGLYFLRILENGLPVQTTKLVKE